MKARRHHRAKVVAALATALLVIGLMQAPFATAQSPNPNGAWKDWRPGNVHYGYTGIIIEGLGMFSCDYSLSSVKAATVHTINDGHATLTEISPQSYCGSLSQYESGIDSLVDYVEGHAAGADTYWAGIILDEEPQFGFTVSQLLSLNQHTATKMVGAPGVSWWCTNLGNSPGYWSQSQYNSLQTDYYPWPAPQVYTNFQASQANAVGLNGNMVTTWTGAPYPYSSASYAIGQIYGSPLYDSFGGAFHYWTWPWQPQ